MKKIGKSGDVDLSKTLPVSVLILELPTITAQKGKKIEKFYNTASFYLYILRKII